MAERPDLEAIRERLHKAKALFPDRPYAPRTFHQQVSDTAELLTYCRELEAELAKEKKGNLDLAAIVREQGCKMMDSNEEFGRRIRELEAENKRLLENGAGRIRMCRECFQPFDPHQVGQTVCQPCAESDPNYGKAYTDKPRP